MPKQQALSFGCRLSVDVLSLSQDKKKSEYCSTRLDKGSTLHRIDSERAKGWIRCWELLILLTKFQSVVVERFVELEVSLQASWHMPSY